MSRIVGIDLGTTNSAVAILEDGAPKIIPTPAGERIVPSVVTFGSQRVLAVGSRAKILAGEDPVNTVFSIKRFMGRRREEVTADEHLVPYPLAGRTGEAARVVAGGREWSPPQVSAEILKVLKAAAASYLKQGVSRAVITVPAYFNDGQRQATKEAGEIAGLAVERILNEPTAAALAYGIDRKLRSGKIAVFDLGGGTFDISLLELNGDIFQVLAVNGDTHLGGDDFDRRLADWLAAALRGETGLDAAADPVLRERLRDVAERAKCELSAAEAAGIDLELGVRGGQSIRFSRVLTREVFERITAEELDRCRRPCLRALADAAVRPDDLSEVILVGGSTRMPAVRRLVAELFGRAPNTSVHPEEAVALGAAIQAGVLQGQVRDVLLLDVTPLYLGIEAFGGVFSKLIDRNSTIPCSAGETFTTWVDGQTAMDIHVLQGERELAKDNRTLARFQLDGIPPQPAGMARAEVTFTLDANGLLNVSARELSTGVTQSVRVKPSSGLTKEEVEAMVRESVESAHEDMAQRWLAEARLEAERVIRATERVLAEGPEVVEILPEDAVRIGEALEATRRAAAGTDLEVIRKAMQRLNEVTEPVAHALLSKAAHRLGDQEVRRPGGAA